MITELVSVKLNFVIGSRYLLIIECGVNKFTYWNAIKTAVGISSPGSGGRWHTTSYSAKFRPSSNPFFAEKVPL